jgi:transcriptional regulator with XRE-family HTH domain
MSIVKDNLKYLRGLKGISQTELATTLGIKRTALNAWETGRANPKYDTAKQIAAFFNTPIDEFLSASLRDIAEEHNSRLRSSKEAAKKPAEGFKVLAITVDSEDRENIEYIPVKAFAGYATGYGDPEYIRELPKFRLPFLGNGTFRAFEIEGESMLPIVPGSIVIGRYVEDAKHLKVGDTYIVVTLNSGILFKRVAKLEKEKIFLKSDNPHFYSYSLPLSEVKEAWKTTLYMSYQFPDPSGNVLERIEKRVEDLQKEVSELKGAA